MRIRRLENELSTACVRARFEISGSLRSGLLWYEVPRSYESWLDEQGCDAAVIGMYPQAMMEARTIEVDGTIETQTMRNLFYYGAVNACWFPSRKSIDVVCQPGVVDAEARGRRRVTALGMSCGVDSLSTFLTWQRNKRLGWEPLQHLIFANVGSHGSGNAGTRLFLKRQRRVEAFAEEVGVPLLVVNSNLDEFYTVRFEESYAARTVSVPVLLCKGISQYIIASTNTYWQLGPEGSSPLTDHLLGGGSVTVIHDGAHLSRIEKMRMLGDWDVVPRHLNVCVQETCDASNCSMCTKCARAMITLEMLGLRRAFERCFDFSILPEARRLYVQRMRQIGEVAPNFYWMEIAQYAREIGYDLAV